MTHSLPSPLTGYAILQYQPDITVDSISHPTDTDLNTHIYTDFTQAQIDAKQSIIDLKNDFLQDRCNIQPESLELTTCVNIWNNPTSFELRYQDQLIAKTSIQKVDIY